jgi:hypothetical protein
MPLPLKIGEERGIPQFQSSATFRSCCKDRGTCNHTSTPIHRIHQDLILSYKLCWLCMRNSPCQYFLSQNPYKYNTFLLFCLYKRMQNFYKTRVKMSSVSLEKIGIRQEKTGSTCTISEPDFSQVRKGTCIKPACRASGVSFSAHREDTLPRIRQWD